MSWQPEQDLPIECAAPAVLWPWDAWLVARPSAQYVSNRRRERHQPGSLALALGPTGLHPKADRPPLGDGELPSAALRGARLLTLQLRELRADGLHLVGQLLQADRGAQEGELAHRQCLGLHDFLRGGEDSPAESVAL